MTESLLLIASLAFVHLLAVMSPGPDFVVAVKNSLKYSRRIGIFTALGFAVGCMIHITYSVLGLAYIINQSVLLFSIIKFLGAAYLIYLGVRALMSKGTDRTIEDQKSKTMITDWQAFREGFITNILNPKATLYFLSVFTLAVGPSTPLWVLVTLSVLIFTITFAWFSLVTVGMTTPHIQKVFLKSSQRIDQVLGFILIGLGLKLIFTHK